jgi:aromatic-amino-acid transaminase
MSYWISNSSALERLTSFWCTGGTMFVVNPVRFGEDPVFALSREAAARAESGLHCVDATLGVLMADSGALAVLPSLVEVMHSSRASDWAPYAGASGLESFSEAVIDECVGAWPTLRSRAVAVATPGATGAIQTALSVFLDRDQAFLSSSLCWGTYPIIAKAAQRGFVTFSMFRDDDLRFDIDAFERALDALIAKQGRALVVLNDPCHNPTGYTMTAHDWASVAVVLSHHCSRAPVTIVLDAVYSAFAPEGMDLALAALEPLTDRLLLALAWSASKALTGYGLRAGALVVIAPTTGRERIHDAMACQCCGTWANCNRGALVSITRLLRDPELRSAVARDRRALVDLLAGRSALFEAEADAWQLPRPRYNGGFFTSVFVKDSQRLAAMLRAEGVYVVPMEGAVRIALCAVKTADVPRLTQRLAAALRDQNNEG